MTDAEGGIRTSTAPAQGRLAGVPEVRVGVSSCLLGQNVRYDGGNKADPIVQALGRVFRWIPLCPEVEVGMGTPREPVVLVDRKGKPPNVRMVGVESATDWTNAMYEFASGHMARFVQQLRWDQAIVDKRVGAPNQFEPAHGDQPGVARPRAY